MANLKATTISDTGFVKLPEGTTAQRPTSLGTSDAGMARFNTTLGVLEWWDGYNWLRADEQSGYITSATGGTITTDGDYRIHTFTSSSTFTPSTIIGNPTIECLVVAGGGAGHYNVGGGGGAGGVLEFTAKHNVDFTAGTGYSVTVGGGRGAMSSGLTNSGTGSNSAVFERTAIGGGGGGSSSNDACFSNSGGCGGGGAGRTSNASNQYAAMQGSNGTRLQGSPGGHGMVFSADTFRGGGGGGGAGEGGRPAPTGSGPVYGGGLGGDGRLSSISGTSTRYAGGGGGGSGNYGPNSYNQGGAGGGGRGGWANADAVAGTANTGGGGGGGKVNGNGGAGGSGIVILRYRYQ